MAPVLILFALALTSCGGGAKPQVAAAPSAASLSLTPSTASQPVGATQQFTVTATFTDNSTRDVTSQAVWTSNADSIASITQSGLATAVASGDAIISARVTFGSNTLNATAPLHITASQLRSITVAPTIDRLDLGVNQQFTATGTFTDGTTEDITGTATWVTSDKAVAFVNTTKGRIGLLHTRGPGEVTVRAIQSGISGSASLTVVRRVPKFLYAAGVGGIDGYAVDPDTGVLSPITGGRFTAVGAITSVAVTRDRRFLYAADPVLGLLWAFRIDELGALEPVPNSPFIPQAGPISVVADPAGDFLFMTDVRGVITTLAVANDGEVTSLRRAVQAGEFPELGAVTPDARFFYQAAAVPASIAGFAVAADGLLAATEQAAVTVAPQPRTLTVDPTGQFLYVTIANATSTPSTSVLGFTIDPVSGELTPIEGSPFTTGENPVFAAADPSGHFLYVVNAVVTHQSAITAFAINPVTGQLTRVPGSPLTVEDFPLSVAVEPGAKFVYAGFVSQGVAGYAIDPSSGNLTEITGSPVAASGAVLGIATTF